MHRDDNSTVKFKGQLRKNSKSKFKEQIQRRNSKDKVDGPDVVR